MPDKIKILVVDDLPEKLLVYQTILEELNEDVVLARSASEALKHLLHEDFAVIILDVNMPEMDGFEAAAMIRARKRCAHTPIIFITAYVDEMHAMKGYSYGAVDYILSPVNPNVLRTKVKVFVDLFRKNIEVQQQGEALRELQAREHRRQLYETEERLRLALHAGRMGACEWDLGANLLNWSPTLESIFGYAPGEFAGTANELSSRLHPDDRKRVLDTMAELVKTASPSHEFCIEHRIIRPNNEVAWVELRGKAFADESGRPARLTGVCLDITQRKQVEAELRRHREMLEELVRQRTAELEASYQRLQLADRLASIGTLAAGLGHDMGNLLLPVRVRLDSLDHRLARITRVKGQSGEVQSSNQHGPDEQGPNEQSPNGQPASAENQKLDIGSFDFGLYAAACLDDIKAIRTACDYLNRLSQGLRLFALDPQKPGHSEWTDLPSWWLDVESFLRNSLPKHVALECRLPATVPPLAIAPHAFTQVIYNLLQNAGDAMRDQPLGRVVLRCQVLSKAAADDADGAADGTGGLVEISVSDDGPGMIETVRQRCMEPFFSTKTRQISTGLGLALVRGAIYNSGGSIDIDSAPGRGTTFRLFLPQAQPKARRQAKSDGQPPAAHIIMQDPRLHAYVKSLLEGFGISVTEDEWSVSSAAHLLVYENPNGRWQDIQEYLARDQNRRAIIIGDALPEGTSPQIVKLGGRPSPVHLRKAIRDALNADEPASGNETAAAEREKQGLRTVLTN